MTQHKKPESEHKPFEAGVDDKPDASLHGDKATKMSQASTTATSATATKAKVTTPLGAGGHVDRLRSLAAALDRNDAAAVKAELKTFVDDLFTDWKPDAAPLVKSMDDPHAESMKAHARRLEEVCQHAEGGTGHAVSRAAAEGGSRWQGVVLPILMQILADLIARQAPKAT